MKSLRIGLLATLLAGITIPCSTSAEQRNISWTPVTTYTDGSPIGADKTLTYSAYWTTDPGLSPATLRQLTSRLPETSFPFDPDNEGMPRGQTIYFTAKTAMSTGEESSFSAALSWKVPVLVPSSPGNITTNSQAPWQLSWESVATYADGSLIGPGQTILYTAYWTPDPYMAPESLHVLGAPTSGTSISFDPALAGMTGYQTVYFAVNAVLATGEGSGFSASVAWDVPLDGPMSPENMAITSLSGDGFPGLQKLSWETVTLYRNGTPIGPGKKVYYNVYWTTDPGLSAGTLKPLASSLEATFTTFDPTVVGMKRSQRVYFSGKSVLSTNEESGLSQGISWRVSNPGPSAPSNGKVVRKNQK